MALIATSGGANRASLWTAVVLDTLEKDPQLGAAPTGGSQFPRHVRLIFGASGGMVGAAHYVATLQSDGSHEHFDRGLVADDYLTPIMNQTVFREVPLLFCPIRWYDRDRGSALDAAIEQTTPALRQPFTTLDAGERAGWRPSLLFSPMLVEDGRRLLIGNRSVRHLTRNEGAVLLEDYSADVMGAVPANACSAPGSRKRRR